MTEYVFADYALEYFRKDGFTMDEEWKESPYSGYLVSSLGRVRGPWGRILVPHMQKYKRGKFQPRVSIGLLGTKKYIYISVLVCETFFGPKPSSRHHAAHRNGNSEDNRLENLRWATAKENEADKKAHGTDNGGTKHYKSNLSLGQVQKIRDLYESGNYTQYNLAGQFGVSQETIWRVVRRKSYV